MIEGKVEGGHKRMSVHQGNVFKDDMKELHDWFLHVGLCAADSSIVSIEFPYEVAQDHDKIST